MSTKLIASTTLYFVIEELQTLHHKVMFVSVYVTTGFFLSFVALKKIEKQRLRAPRNSKRYFNLVPKFLSFDKEKEVNDTWKSPFLLAVKYATDRIKNLASFLL